MRLRSALPRRCGVATENPRGDSGAATRGGGVRDCRGRHRPGRGCGRAKAPQPSRPRVEGGRPRRRVRGFPPGTPLPPPTAARRTALGANTYILLLSLLLTRSFRTWRGQRRSPPVVRRRAGEADGASARPAVAGCFGCRPSSPSRPNRPSGWVQSPSRGRCAVRGRGGSRRHEARGPRCTSRAGTARVAWPSRLAGTPLQTVRQPKRKEKTKNRPIL